MAILDGGVEASTFEETFERRIWDKEVEESRGKFATVCVAILRMYYGVLKRF
jgi:hypothetical protein